MVKIAAYNRKCVLNQESIFSPYEKSPPKLMGIHLRTILLISHLYSKWQSFTYRITYTPHHRQVAKLPVMLFFTPSHNKRQTFTSSHSIAEFRKNTTNFNFINLLQKINKGVTSYDKFMDVTTRMALQIIPENLRNEPVFLCMEDFFSFSRKNRGLLYWCP